MVVVKLSLGAEKPQCRKTKYNPKVYNNMLLLGSADGAPTVSMLIPRCQCQDFEMVFKVYCINNHNNVAQK